MAYLFSVPKHKAYFNDSMCSRSFKLIIEYGFGDEEAVRDRAVEFLESKTTIVPPEFFTSPDVEALFVQVTRQTCSICVRFLICFKSIRSFDILSC